jgi:epoxyqueuosine reductase
VSIRGEKIKSLATQSGFSFCGIAKAEPLEDHRSYNEGFIRQKRHQTFSYLETNLSKRINPLEIMPDARSVIAVLLNYFPGKLIPEEDNFIISKYSYGNDYYKVVKKKLNEIGKFITSPPDSLLEERGEVRKGIKALCFVDSGSVLEKVWAQKCGVGWQGKNTLLINKTAGSFFFIGIILTNLEIEPDDPETDHCGSCNKCAMACPTGALDQPYCLNISKCISFHTIENKNPIPDEFRGKFRDRIFGCDICQDVCPYNRFSTPSGDPSRNPKPDLLKMKKKEWLSLTEDQFTGLFKGTPVFRTGYRRLMENISFMIQ